jgi:hypothetical protein
LDLDWDVILQAAQSGAVDMFLNFPVMDIPAIALTEPGRLSWGVCDLRRNSGRQGRADFGRPSAAAIPRSSTGSNPFTEITSTVSIP